MLERKLHTIYRGSDAFVDIAITENGLFVGSDGVARCDVTFERPGSASVTISSVDNPEWFTLQHETSVNGRTMNVVRVNLGNAPEPAIAGRWEARVTIFDDLDGSFDCGVFNVEFGQLGATAPTIGGGGGGEGPDTRYALSDHSLTAELTDEIVGPGAIGAPLAAFILFMTSIGGPPNRGTLRLYVGQTNSVSNGVLTVLDVDGGSVLGTESAGLTLPAAANLGGGGWSSSTFEGVIVDVPAEWWTGELPEPFTDEFEVAIELVSGFEPSTDYSLPIDGTFVAVGTSNIGARAVTSSGVFVWRVSIRDPVTLVVHARCDITFDLDTIFI